MMDATNESFRPLTESDIPYIDGQMEESVNSPEFGNDHKGTNGNKTESSEQTDTCYDDGGLLSMCGKCSFPWLLTISMVQLGIYLNKLYQDSAAVAIYYNQRDLNFCIVSAFCLFIPAAIYIIYGVAVYVKQEEEAEPKEVGNKVVHGLLLVPWQIKGRVELLHFSAQRVCLRRKLTHSEMEEKSILQRQAAVLEFFEEFYAGFIQLLLQLYIIITSLDKNIDSKALPWEIIASGLTLMSMMAAVRRKDDGILTGFLSITGWLSIMISRSIAISLATTAIHGWMIIICLLHGIIISFWLLQVAIQTSKEESPTTLLSSKKKLAIFFLIFSVFGLPSLTYWPIMFQLKENKRPLIFLLILLVENIIFTVLWLIYRENSLWGKHDYILVSVMAGGYIIGALFIMFYIFCKPKYTDQVVYHDMKIRNADSFGMYFEFCDIAFKLPRRQEVEVKLRKIREQDVVLN